ncbi:MAG TPA: M48 family metallopeptidase [Solimonas sp.]|nr:M48 family metallopeptidase [Solimonas sp.]
MPRHLPVLAAAAIAAALITACATSPTGRTQLRLVSDAEMDQMGVTAFQQMKTKTPTTQNAKTNAYVSCVANALTREVPGGRQWEVQVFEDKQVNAFALPGGKIGVYTGLLKVATNQDQLAAVIGHEVSHVLAGHSASRVSNQMASQLGVSILSAASGVNADMIGMGANLLLILPFSRGDETEADVLGEELMARAGFDPRQAAELWRNMAKASSGAPPQFMSTHPANETRINDLNAHLSKAMPLYEQARSQGKTPRCS